MLDFNHPRYDEFMERLEGPEGCNFRKHPEKGTVWTCDSSDRSRPLSRAILTDMGFSEKEIADTLDFFDQHGGYCDCEVLFNVDQ